ncbi:MAG: hypothetical protein ACOZAM_14970 [Pseudomonadota bacterium]
MTREELLSRLESGSGADKELDLAIATMAFPEAGPCTPLCEGNEPIFWHSPLYKQPCPTYTSSLDAALSLVERMLPGSFYFLGKGKLKPDEPLFAAQIYKAGSIGDEALLGEAEHVSSQARALLIALLRALDQEPQT